MITRLCIIDDRIPTVSEKTIDDTKMLNPSNLRLLLKYDWKEPELKTLVEKLLERGDKWAIGAFTQTSLFMNHLTEENLRPEIVVYDWDTGTRTPMGDLLEILKATFCVVVIYTRGDKEPDINKEVFKSPAFADYVKRIRVILKEAANSDQQLMSTAEEMYKSNFSYQIGTELRQMTLRAVDSILVELGKNSPEDVVWLLGEEDGAGNTRELAVNDLVAIIVEKVRNNLITCEFGTKLPAVASEPKREVDNETTKRLWAYRMYYRPSDNVVRQGDIIKKTGANTDTLHLVISADCHLNQFWKKNMGSLTLVPLHRIGPDNAGLKGRMDLLNKPSELRKIKCTSITNANGVTGPTIMPVLAFQENVFPYYLLCPREIFSVNVPLPAIPNVTEKKREIRLLYKYVTEYEGAGRIGVSEPFLTPLIQFVLANITSYGTPDYPEELRTLISNGIREMFPS